jgi:hypothetical protein
VLQFRINKRSDRRLQESLGGEHPQCKNDSRLAQVGNAYQSCLKLNVVSCDTKYGGVVPPGVTVE